MYQGTSRFTHGLRARALENQELVKGFQDFPVWNLVVFEVNLPEGQSNLEMSNLVYWFNLPRGILLQLSFPFPGWINQRNQRTPYCSPKDMLVTSQQPTSEQGARSQAAPNPLHLCAVAVMTASPCRVETMENDNQLQWIDGCCYALMD